MRFIVASLFLLISSVAHAQTTATCEYHFTQTQPASGTFSCTSNFVPPITPPDKPPTAQVFNCTTFAATGDCGVRLSWDGPAANPFYAGGSGGTKLRDGQVVLVDAGCVHCATGLTRKDKVSVRAFEAIYEFVPNGWNISLVFNNSTNNPWGCCNGPEFSSGAGCEGGFFQAGGQPAPPNRVFAVMLDQYEPLYRNMAGNGQEPFTYSSTQIYRTDATPAGPTMPPGQMPCQLTNANIAANPVNYSPVINVHKVSTAPVALNMPAGSPLTTTGKTYVATVLYNGANLVLNLAAKGDDCPGDKCFTYTWTGVDIPAAVGADTAYVGLTSSSNNSVPVPMLVRAFGYYVPQ